MNFAAQTTISNSRSANNFSWVHMAGHHDIFAEVSESLCHLFTRLLPPPINRKINLYIDIVYNTRVKYTTNYLSTIFNLEIGGEYKYNGNNLVQKRLQVADIIPTQSTPTTSWTPNTCNKAIEN